MGEIPRERFVPEAKRAVAYVDEDIPIGSGRYIMEPMVLGRLLEAAAVQPGDVALVVGCGTDTRPPSSQNLRQRCLPSSASANFRPGRRRNLQIWRSTTLSSLKAESTEATPIKVRMT